uniref:Uncharacterized protein n=1 Tax=Zooxanthella nutricula TaxID=1333877 RepID=A0A6V0DSW4_9DINO|mmetsp:Transcript_100636/g.307526  ORF Transcript_100636/g.307526 Transcript_100636/m.307526 type:complete len:566 (+) Transcript_100636:77-1774(+)
MQPLAYLAVRALLGWLQLVERTERAFLHNQLVLVAAGAVHSWAVVYSLFVAVHTRAMRFEGYHEGYVEHLPWSVGWTETLAVASLWIWVLAGFTTAAVRILDEDADGLPVGLDDVKGNPITKIIRSPVFHSALGHAHSISCAGLFISILLLCATMAFMKGGITACEVCLAIVANAFALPHAVLAIRRLSEDADRALRQALGEQTAESAAAEAAALGPQLCIIFALADAPGHAYLWQNLIYILASFAFVAAVASCARSPPKADGVALPPEAPETFVGLALDAAAGVAIVLSYPHLNTWFLWACAVGLIGAAAALHLPDVRAFYIDWLEPLLIVRSDNHRRLPGQQRQKLRRSFWMFAIVAASTAMWDILLHPAPEILNTDQILKSLHQASHYWDKVHDLFPEFLMLRWQAENGREAHQLKALAADAVGVDPNVLEVQTTLDLHRLVVFKYIGAEAASDSKDKSAQRAKVHLEWQATMSNPADQLADVVDRHFPSALNVTTCSEVLSNQTAAGEKQLALIAPERKEEARSAFVAACDWYKSRNIHAAGSASKEATEEKEEHQERKGF